MAPLILYSEESYKSNLLTPLIAPETH